MRHSQPLPILRVLCWLTIVLLFGSAAASSEPQDTADYHRSLYHTDPNHLWNRLHDAMFVRVGRDNRAYGQDRLEPLLWTESKHLLEPGSHDPAVAVLQEFIDANGETLIDDGLKRAILQRDLWLIADWLGDSSNQLMHPQREKLQRLVGTIICRLAMSREQISSLPDNYAAAVASGKFAIRYESATPETPYLPPDLFSKAAAWVCVGQRDGVTAPQHLRSDFLYTNSVFFVFVRLPADRDATVQHMTQLLEFSKPLVVKDDKSPVDRFAFVPNPEIPQFPVGTELALVRQMMLIDQSNRIVMSPMIESIQFRKFHGDTGPSAANTQDAADLGKRFSAGQTFHEACLSRRQLFAGDAGGLRVVTTDEGNFKTGFNAKTIDPFERFNRSDREFPSKNERFGAIRRCFGCHRMSGVYSFSSYHNSFSSTIALKKLDARHELLALMSAPDVAQAAIRSKESQGSWSALKRFLTK